MSSTARRCRTSPRANLLFSHVGLPGRQPGDVFASRRIFNLSGQDQCVCRPITVFYEQNQDSIGAVEYSIDGGQHWLPVVYHAGWAGRAARWRRRGGCRQSFHQPLFRRGRLYQPGLPMPLPAGTMVPSLPRRSAQSLAPYISARVNDDPVESKRVELFRLPAADNQAAVRFRFAQAGTDSWYWGIDDFGLYSITPWSIFGDHALRSASVERGRGGQQPRSAWTATGPYLLSYQWQFNGAEPSGATNSMLVISECRARLNQGVYTGHHQQRFRRHAKRRGRR